MSVCTVHLCFNLIDCEGTTNTRFHVSNCAVYLADSCLISRFLALFTSSRSRVLAYSSFACSRNVFSSFSCHSHLANSSSRLYRVLAIYSRKLAFSYSRILVFFTCSLIILANSHSRPKHESTRGRRYELRRISHHRNDSFWCIVTCFWSNLVHRVLHTHHTGEGPRVVVSTAAFHARVRGSAPGLGGFEETKMFHPHPRVKVSIVGSLRDREVACSASDRQGSNFESCVWRKVSSHSSHHPQEVLLAQFSLYVHKGGLKPDSFHFTHTTVEM